jgi:hypothetical protein
MIGGQIPSEEGLTGGGKVVGDHEEVEENLWRALVGVEEVGDELAAGASAPAMVRPVLQRLWRPEWWGCGLGSSRGARQTGSGGLLGWRRCGNGGSAWRS